MTTKPIRCPLLCACLLALLSIAPKGALAHWDNLYFNHDTGEYKTVNPMTANQKDFDADLDGYITLDEALDFTLRVFEAWDNNQDLVLEPNEFPLQTRCSTTMCIHKW